MFVISILSLPFLSLPISIPFRLEKLVETEKQRDEARYHAAYSASQLQDSLRFSNAREARLTEGLRQAHTALTVSKSEASESMRLLELEKKQSQEKLQETEKRLETEFNKKNQQLVKMKAAWEPIVDRAAIAKEATSLLSGQATWLGFEVIREPFSQDAGLKVINVASKSPADLAGILVGDIICEFNRKSLFVVQDMIDSTSTTVPGSFIQLMITRTIKGATSELTILLHTRSRALNPNELSFLRDLAMSITDDDSLEDRQADKKELARIRSLIASRTSKRTV